MRAVAESTIRRLGAFRRPLARFLDYQDETLRLGDMYMTGAHQLQGAYELTQAHLHAERVLGRSVDEDASERNLRRAQELADLAKLEAEGGFRLLNSHLLVGIWGVFETVLDDFVLNWMTARPSDLIWQDNGEVKLPPAAVFAADSRERAEIFLEAVRRRRGAPLSSGVKRFEDTLALVGLDGALPEGLSECIFEMQQVRNSYAHCGGMIDDRMASALAYMPLSLGAVVPVTPTILHSYSACLAVYVTLIVKRGWAKQGILSSADNSCYWCKTLTSEDAVKNLPYPWEPGTPLRRHFSGRSEVGPDSSPAT